MSNEAFEKWAIDYGLDYEPSFTRDDVEASWQAAKADSEQEIAELDNKYLTISDSFESINTELQAYIYDLREALEDIATDSGGCCDSGYSSAFVAKNILSKTPAQSLQEHDNEVIEKCAKVVEMNWASVDCLYAIRALKG